MNTGKLNGNTVGITCAWGSRPIATGSQWYKWTFDTYSHSLLQYFTSTTPAWFSELASGHFPMAWTGSFDKSEKNGDTIVILFSGDMVNTDAITQTFLVPWFSVSFVLHWPCDDRSILILLWLDWSLFEQPCVFIVCLGMQLNWTSL